MTFKEKLQAVGLSEKEALVFCALLEEKRASVQEISKRSGVNRSTTYLVLDSLVKKGFCRQQKKNSKEIYVAEDPETILTSFSLRKSEIKEKQEHLKNIISELRSIHNRKQNKPVVRFFEGAEGLKAISNEMLRENEDTMRMLYSVDAIEDVFSKDELEQARAKRLEKTIKTRVLYSWKHGEKKSSADGKRLKIVGEDIPITCDIAVVGNKIRLVSLKNNMPGVLLEDEEIAKTLNSIFELAWKGALLRKNKRQETKNFQ